MCLIVFAWRPGHALPLLLAANRDEFHARPSLPLAAWEDAPAIIGGRDLQAGGTWLGIRPDGRFAALTNIRNGGQPAGRRSRGELVERYLRDELAPADYLAGLAAGIGDYAGFNLLAGTARELWHFNSQSGAPRRLEAGVYGLCNADLDTPWPKLRRARSALAARLELADIEALLQLLDDREPAPDAELPSTGVSLEWERRLSSIFITGAEYGTRASTALLRWQDGAVDIHERRFGPAGVLGDTRYRLPPRD
ncbi:hypothetical protein YO5_18752 [Stutzerimonas stutzeri TS44]|nr:hypothetical protein YO5_18752 [Stutzerimonas stutzeri TS44]